MKLPPGVSEQQVLDAIENAVKILAPSFTFGIYDIEDVKQEARLEGWRVIGRYDATRPLDNFIYTCIRNRLIRLKRDKLRRNDPPCQVCHQSTGHRSQHEDGQFCPRYLAWRKRNEAKASLMRPLDLDHVSDAARRESEVAQEAGVNEMLALIDRHLDVDLRADYLRMRAGKSVAKARRMAVEAAVREILSDALTGDDDA